MAAGPDDLCTVADLKSWLPNQGNNDDTTLQCLITNASLQVLLYVNRLHLLASVLGALTETYDGNDADRLLPRYYPIIGVTAVTIDGTAIQQSQGFNAGSMVAGFSFDARRIFLRGFVFVRGLQNVQMS